MKLTAPIIAIMALMCGVTGTAWSTDAEGGTAADSINIIDENNLKQGSGSSMARTSDYLTMKTKTKWKKDVM